MQTKNNYAARINFILLLACLVAGTVTAQQQLHIHQINIENGDATLIGIYDEALQKYTSKILIDGGQSAPEKLLLPYIAKMIGNDAAASHFDYVVLTHYHDDHYNGLQALQDGRITADSIIDPGGYRVSSYFRHGAVAGTKPAKLQLALPWLRIIKAAARHTPQPFIKGRSKILIRYDTTAETDIGRKITLGTVGGSKVELECIAGWGNTLSENGQIQPNPAPSRKSANNFTLAFILSCGEFRYFIGGDMGGTGGSYIDQETTVTKFLNDAYPASVSAAGDVTLKGHVCGLKANHHGSNNSNNAAFMQGMHPSVIMSSGGNNEGWHIPNPQYITRLAAVQPLSVAATLPAGSFNQGVYFTNLYNFPGFSSLDTANNAFRNKPGISYSYGNDTATAKNSYLIKIKGTDMPGEKSVFETGLANISLAVPYQKLGQFFCHKK